MNKIKRSLIHSLKIRLEGNVIKFLRVYIKSGIALLLLYMLIKEDERLRDGVLSCGLYC